MQTRVTVRQYIPALACVCAMIDARQVQHLPLYDASDPPALQRASIPRELDRAVHKALQIPPFASVFVPNQ